MNALQIVVASVLAIAGAMASAQPFPNKPITMVVPFPPGGIADLTGRVLAPAMSKSSARTS